MAISVARRVATAVQAADNGLEEIAGYMGDQSGPTAELEKVLADSTNVNDEPGAMALRQRVRDIMDQARSIHFAAGGTEDDLPH